MIYVDALMSHGWRLRGYRVKSCHMITDGPVEELHAFAVSIGMKRSWFQDHDLPHYDLTAKRRADAIRMGAVEIDRKRMVGFIYSHKRRANENKNR